MGSETLAYSESAIASPEASFAGKYLHATAPEMAAAYLFTSRKTFHSSTGTSAALRRQPSYSCI